jgi:hypothetical protein
VILELSHIEPLGIIGPCVDTQATELSIFMITFERLSLRRSQFSQSGELTFLYAACVDITCVPVVDTVPHAAEVSDPFIPVAVRFDDACPANYFIVGPVALPQLLDTIFPVSYLRAAPRKLPVLHLPAVRIISLTVYQDAVLAIEFGLVPLERLQRHPQSIAFAQVTFDSLWFNSDVRIFFIQDTEFCGLSLIVVVKPGDKNYQAGAKRELFEAEIFLVIKCLLFDLLTRELCL